MAKQQQTRYADFLTEWQHLINTLAANAPELPHLESSRAKLQGFLDEVRKLSQEQAVHAANKQAASQQLRAAFTSGKKLATFLRTGIKEHYGNRNEKLVEFRVQPFRRTKPEATVTKPPVEEAPDVNPAG